MASFKLVLFSEKRNQHRIEIFVLLCFFSKHAQRTTDKMAEHYSQDSYLYFIRSIGQQRALYIKMASFKLVLFSKKRKQHRIEILVLLCLFSKHAQRTTDIRWRNTIHRTLIFILEDPLANRGHSISKWLLLNSCCFLKNANSTESRFLFCVAFFQNTHNAQLI